MGTRRSRHNKGRKPLYKEHGRDSVRHLRKPKEKREKIVPLNRGGVKHNILQVPEVPLQPADNSALLRGSRSDIEAIVWGLRPRVAAIMRSFYRRVDPEIIEEAVAEGALHALDSYQEVLADAAKSSMEDAIVATMRRGASRFLGDAMRSNRRSISLSTPLGEDEEGELTLAALIQSRRYTPGHLEDHVDARRFGEAAATLDAHQTKVLAGLIDGLSAEEAAKEFNNMTPNELRIERSRVLSRLREVRRSQ